MNLTMMKVEAHGISFLLGKMSTSGDGEQVLHLTDDKIYLPEQITRGFLGKAILGGTSQVRIKHVCCTIHKLHIKNKLVDIHGYALIPYVHK